MKVKTIKKIIETKFNEFASSIEDTNVRKLVQDNTIISGGCIPSMLLKEHVNDFDLYFTNKETVKSVAEYYVKKFSETPHKDKIPVDIFVFDGDDPSTYKDHGSNSLVEPGRIKIYIKSAGVASESADDGYQYFENEPQDAADNYIDDLVSVLKNDELKTDTFDAKPSYRPVFLSANAITLSNKIQLVIRFYGNPDTIHQHYDYIHCTSYWLSSTGNLYLKPAAMQAILTKELIYIGSKYPLCSIIRTRKFIKRGWSINAGQYLKMCFQLSKLNLSDIHVLEEQLTGVDAAYFGQLIEELRKHTDKQKEEGKEFKLEYGYLATIIDKIF